MNRALAVVFGVLLSVALLLTVLYVQCTSPALMERRFETFAQAPGDYGLLAGEITAYLSGGDVALSYFQRHEQAHMQDVRALVALLKGVLLGLWPCTLIFGLFLLKKPVSNTVAWTMTGAALLVLFIAFWGALDFNGLFILFHKLAFTNDLWLLDPATDYLIQLMPIGFFMAYALSIGLIWLTHMAVAIFLCFRAQRRNHGLFFLFKTKA